jgi:hypothetical protein
LTVEGLKPDAFLGEFVDVGRLNLAASIAEVGIAQIVSHDENDVGPLVIRLDGGRRA